MKKHKIIKCQPLFNKEKEYLKIINNPNKLNQLKELVNNAVNIKSKVEQPKTLNDWFIYVLTILPKFEKELEFTEKLKGLINDYSNEPEGSDTIKSC